MEAEYMENENAMEENSWPIDRGEAGSAIGGQVGGQAGMAVGTSMGGPIGGLIGKYIGEKIGSFVGDKAEDKAKEEIEQQAKKKGSSSKESEGNVDTYQASDANQPKNPESPHHKLEIWENKLPENWWDKIPDFDPRVYDAIAMEQASACVKYIFDGLPDMHELEHLIESRKNRKNCPRLKVCVPRTKVIKPNEIQYDTLIEDWNKTDRTY